MSITPVIQISAGLTGSYQVNLGYHDYIVDCSLGSISLQLPAIVTSGLNVQVTRNDSGPSGATGATLLINPATGQNINRQSSAIVQPDKTQTRFISYYKSVSDIGWFYGITPIEATGATGPQGATGSIVLGPIGNNANSTGLGLTGNTLNLQPASANSGGVVTTGPQQFAGAKQFVEDKQAFSDTDAAVTVAGGVGITRQLILGPPGDITNLSGLIINSSLVGYNATVLNFNEDGKGIYTGISPFYGSTLIYLNRIGRAVTMTINAFTGGSTGASAFLFKGVPNRFMPSAVTNFSTTVTTFTPPLITNYTIQLDPITDSGANYIRLYGTNFANGNFPSVAFAMEQTILSYNAV